LPDGIFSHQKKQTLWAYFGGMWNLKCWYILWPFGLLYGHLVYYMAIWYMYYMAIWYIKWPFGILYG
jgi:hypothetical protein